MRLNKGYTKFQYFDGVGEDQIKTMLKVCNCLVKKKEVSSYPSLSMKRISVIPCMWTQGKCVIKQHSAPPTHQPTNQVWTNFSI